MAKAEKHKILVVDDSEANVDVLFQVLRHDYTVSVAMNGREALDLVEDDPPDLILLDVMMPGMDGYEVCRRLKESELYREIPVIFLTAMDDEDDEARGLDLGAVDYIIKPFRPRLLERRVKTQISLKEHRDNLEEIVRERTRLLNLTQDVTIESLGNLAEYRDQETGGHIKRTKNYVRHLAEEIRRIAKYPEHFMDDAYIDLLTKSAPLHDIGKVGVPDSILLKPGKLTPEEFEEMKKHTLYGRDIIAASEKSLGEDSFLSIAREIAYSHHEKWDGSGYPEAKKGRGIPLSGRMMAIADVYDALISKRVYKPPFPHEKALGIILEGRGKHFDPDMVDIFAATENKFREIAIKYADFDEEREVLSST
ncbi:MAG: two-component system response regulator [Desulfamplus sp.]|nr:two-component system response regulator [Desulfamplus sp.]